MVGPCTSILACFGCKKHRVTSEKSEGPPEQAGVDKDAAVEASRTASVEETGEDWSWHQVVLGRYKVRGTDVLGIGNFSVVRRGVDSETGEIVAVKTLKDASDSKFRREVLLFREIFGGARDMPSHKQEPSAAPVPSCKQSEVEAIALPGPREMFVRMLNHTPLEATPDARQYYGVFELGEFNMHELVLNCGDMAARCAHGHSLSKESDILRALYHVVRALCFLHSRHLAHGDVKPANVMWFKDGEELGMWKLIDLDGLLTFSQLIDMRDADFYTPIYAPPELASAVVVGESWRVSCLIDIWATGAMLLELELLRPPLWDKFEELSQAGEGGAGNNAGGVVRFMQWLSEAPSPMPFPEIPRVASIELFEVMRTSMLVRDPMSRASAADLMRHPYLTHVWTGSQSAAPPTLESAKALPAPIKPPTAFQLFQAQQKPALEEEGLRGTKLMQELHRRWQRLLEEGGEQLEQLKCQEAALSQASNS